MAEFTEVAIRSALTFFILLILARFMGKRQISQLNFFDYITGITIGSIAATLSSEPSARFPSELTSLLVWAFLTWLLAYLSLRSAPLRRLVQGQPTALIQQGKVIRANLAKNRYNLDDLLAQLRRKNIFSLADVEMAILETDGHLSVEKKAEQQPLTPATAGVTVAQGGTSAAVILDGRVMPKALRKTGRDESWLHQELEKQGISDYKEVFLAQVTPSGGLWVDRMSDFRPNWHPQNRKALLAALLKAEADIEQFALETENPKAKKLYQDLAERIARVRGKAEPFLV